MAQHDYDIANQTAPNFRADLNNALDAIASTNSGTSAPSTTFANMLWYDTTNNILKMRNEGDSAWIDLFDLDQSGNLSLQSNIASQAQAEAGTASTVGMTPQRTKQAIDALSPGFVAATTGGVATTSGSTVTLTTSIPADVKQIIITFNGVSINSTSAFLVQLGDSGGFETTGYNSTSTRTNGLSTSTSTAGFIVNSGSASHATYGSMILTRHEVTNDVWVGQHAVRLDNQNVAFGGGAKGLDTDVTQIRLEAIGGATFDAGEANVLWM